MNFSRRSTQDGSAARLSEYDRTTIAQRWRRQRWSLVLLIGLLLVLFFVVPWILEKTVAKSFLEKNIAESLQYPVRIDAVEVRLFWPPTWVAKRLQAFDGRNQIFFTAEQAKFQFNPLTLVLGRVNLRRVIIANGTLRVERAADGSWNAPRVLEFGNDPDRSVDFSNSRVDFRNIDVAVIDRALPQIFTEQVRVQEFSLSHLLLQKPSRVHLRARAGPNLASEIEVAGEVSLPPDKNLFRAKGELRATATPFEVQWLNSYMREVGAVSGQFDVQLRLQGQGRDWKTEATIQFRDARWNASKAERSFELGSGAWKVAARLQDEQTLAVEEISGDAAGFPFVMCGEVNAWRTRAPRMALRFQTEDFEIADRSRQLIGSFASAFERAWLKQLSGKVRLMAQLNGTPEKPAFGWKVELKEAAFKDASSPFQCSRMVGEVSSSNHRMKVAIDRAEVLRGHVALYGMIDADAMDVNLRASRLSLAEVFALAHHFGRSGKIEVPAWTEKIAAVEGTTQADLRLQGARTRLRVSGRATFDRASVRWTNGLQPFSNFSGTVQLSPQEVRFIDVAGNVGASPLELRGVLTRSSRPTWHTFQVTARDFDLDNWRALRELNLFDWPAIGRLGDLQQADGKATVLLQFEDSKAYASARLDDASLRFSGPPAPITRLNGRVEVSPDGLRFEALSGALSASSFQLDGEVEHLGSTKAQWRLNVSSSLHFPEANELLPERLRGHLRAQGRIPVELQLDGREDQGVRVSLRTRFAANTELEMENLFRKESDQSGELALEGEWRGEDLWLKETSLRLNEVALEAHGVVKQFRSDDPQLELTVRLPNYFPTEELMKIVPSGRLTSSPVTLEEGRLAGEVQWTGPIASPAFAGRLRFSEVAVRGLPWKDFHITGELEISPSGAHTRNFLAMVSSSPIKISGQWNHGSAHRAELAIESLNLDVVLPPLVKALTESTTALEIFNDNPLVLDLTSAMGQYRGLLFSELHARVQIDGKQVAIPSLSAHFIGAPLRGTLNLQTDNHETALSLQASDVPLKELMNHVTKFPPKADARLSLIADLRGRGLQGKAFASSLEGTAHFELHRGRFEKTSLPQRILSLAALVHDGIYGFNLGRIFQTIDPPKFDRFDRWAGDLTFSQGVAQLDNLDFVSDIFNMQGQGAIATDTGKLQIQVRGSLPDIPVRSNMLSQIFGRLSIRSIVGATKYVGKLLIGRWEKPKPHRHHFTFTLGGTLWGRKSIENFKFGKE